MLKGIKIFIAVLFIVMCQQRIFADKIVSKYSRQDDSPQICTICKGKGESKCYICSGKGYVREECYHQSKNYSGSDWRCNECGATGNQYYDGKPRRYNKECVQCNGTGKINCKYCKGKGFVN
jgi:hypothetical protein